jgi:amino acid transporter
MAIWDLLATKPVEHIIAQSDSAQGMRRSLTALDVTLLGVGVVMGTGIFVLTGRAAAANAGPAISLSFMVAGLAAALAGLCYSEMASMIPVSGSAYTYAYATMGELAAFVIGWDLILEYLVGAATVTVGWSGYFTALCRRLFGITLPLQYTQAPIAYDDVLQEFVATGAYLNVPASLFALSITALLVVGTRESARFNSVIVGIKLLAVALFLGFGVFYIDTANYTPFLPPNTGTFGRYGISGLFQGATMVFFAYVGFDAISTVAQETRRPQRDLPIGMLASLAFCTVMYVATSLVLCGVVNYTQLSVPHPMALGVAKVGRPWLEAVVDIGALAGLTSGALVTLMGQPRVIYAMAQDGLFFKFGTVLHPRFRTPHLTTLLCGGICATVGGLLPIEVLGELTSIGTLFAFALVSLSVMILRLQRPDLPRRFRVAGGNYLIPLSATAISVGLMATATAQSLLRLFAWMLCGLVVYALYGRRHSRLRRRNS